MERKRSSRKRRAASSSSSSSSSSDSESSESSSESENGGRSHRKHKSKRRKSEKRSSKKKHKKDDKKKKRKHKKKHKSSSHAVNQNEYGKYGILRESDFHTKSVSFQAWLRDIKKMGDFNGPKWEAMELFKEYMEDFNTATLPHEKYYDVEKYELQQFQKKQRKQSQRAGESLAGAMLADEDRVRQERQAARVAKERQDFQLVLQTMDKDKIESMRSQESLRAEMQMHYKAGNVAEARRLEQLLKADDDRLKRA